MSRDSNASGPKCILPCLHQSFGISLKKNNVNTGFHFFFGPFVIVRDGIYLRSMYSTQLDRVFDQNMPEMYFK